jgi:uncharacterized protein (TIGR03435 family)
MGYAQDLKPMAANANPSFDVATIKPADPDAHGQGFQTRGRRIHLENESVQNMLMFAYGIHPKQIVNAPAWFATARYNVDGVPDVEGYASLKQFQGMVQKLLAERFHVTFHHDSRELSVYAVRIGKGGSKLVKSAHDPSELPDQTGNGREWRFTNNSMHDFAGLMQSMVDRPVVDQTELPGKFDFLLKWTPNEAPTSDPNAPPGIFTAVQEQLGLKLEPARSSVDVLVIDHAERPTEN